MPGGPPPVDGAFGFGEAWGDHDQAVLASGGGVPHRARPIGVGRGDLGAGRGQGPAVAVSEASVGVGPISTAWAAVASNKVLVARAILASGALRVWCMGAFVVKSNPWLHRSVMNAQQSEHQIVRNATKIPIGVCAGAHPGAGRVCPCLAPGFSASWGVLGLRTTRSRSQGTNASRAGRRFPWPGGCGRPSRRSHIGEPRALAVCLGARM